MSRKRSARDVLTRLGGDGLYLRSASSCAALRDIVLSHLNFAYTFEELVAMGASPEDAKGAIAAAAGDL